MEKKENFTPFISPIEFSEELKKHGLFVCQIGSYASFHSPIIIDNDGIVLAAHGKIIRLPYDELAKRWEFVDGTRCCK